MGAHAGSPRVAGPQVGIVHMGTAHGPGPGVPGSRATMPSLGRRMGA